MLSDSYDYSFYIKSQSTTWVKREAEAEAKKNSKKGAHESSESTPCLTSSFHSSPILMFSLYFLNWYLKVKMTRWRKCSPPGWSAGDTRRTRAGTARPKVPPSSCPSRTPLRRSSTTSTACCIRSSGWGLVWEGRHSSTVALVWMPGALVCPVLPLSRCHPSDRSVIELSDGDVELLRCLTECTEVHLKYWNHSLFFT